MNNCIGLNNTKAFLLFNFYVFICALWTVIRLVAYGYNCNKDVKCTTFENATLGGFTVLVGALCGMFALFTVIMFTD